MPDETCHCDPPRYMRLPDGTWRSRIWRDGGWAWIRDGARKCAKCGHRLERARDSRD